MEAVYIPDDNQWNSTSPAPISLVNVDIDRLSISIPRVLFPKDDPNRVAVDRRNQIASTIIDDIAALLYYSISDSDESAGLNSCANRIAGIRKPIYGPAILVFNPQGRVPYRSLLFGVGPLYTYFLLY